MLERDVVSAIGSWLGLRGVGAIGADGNGNGNGDGNGNGNGGAGNGSTGGGAGADADGAPLDAFERGWGYMVPGSSLGNLQGGQLGGWLGGCVDGRLGASRQLHWNLGLYAHTLETVNDPPRCR
jgi:hypothetical protein